MQCICLLEILAIGQVAYTFELGIQEASNYCWGKDFRLYIETNTFDRSHVLKCTQSTM